MLAPEERVPSDGSSYDELIVPSGGISIPLAFSNSSRTRTRRDKVSICFFWDNLCRY